MGDFFEMQDEGLLDESGEATQSGYEKNERVKLREYIKGVKDNQLFGVLNWVINKSEIPNDSGKGNVPWATEIMQDYAISVLNLPGSMSNEVIANTIQQNFTHFTKWARRKFKSSNNDNSRNNSIKRSDRKKDNTRTNNEERW